MRRESGTSTKASGEKKSRPSPLPPPVLKNFPFSTCIRPSATRRRSISREHTLWLASLFPAINRFRRKNRGELVGKERGGGRGLPPLGKVVLRASSLLLSEYDGDESRLFGFFPTRSQSVSNCETDTMTTWTHGWEEGREEGGEGENRADLKWRSRRRKRKPMDSFIWGVLRIERRLR